MTAYVLDVCSLFRLVSFETDSLQKYSSTDLLFEGAFDQHVTIAHHHAATGDKRLKGAVFVQQHHVGVATFFKAAFARKLEPLGGIVVLAQAKMLSSRASLTLRPEKFSAASKRSYIVVAVNIQQLCG